MRHTIHMDIDDLTEAVRSWLKEKGLKVVGRLSPVMSQGTDAHDRPTGYLVLNQVDVTVEEMYPNPGKSIDYDDRPDDEPPGSFRENWCR